jgi:hypothetical protein
MGDIFLMISYSSPARVVGSPDYFLSRLPISFAQVPVHDTVHDKLGSFVDGVPSLANSSKVEDDLAQDIYFGSNSAT